MCLYVFIYLDYLEFYDQALKKMTGFEKQSRLQPVDSSEDIDQGQRLAKRRKWFVSCYTNTNRCKVKQLTGFFKNQNIDIVAIPC